MPEQDQVGMHADVAARLYATDQFEEALHHFVVLTNLSPNIALNYQYAGMCLNRLNRDQEAIPYLEKAVGLDSSNALSWFELACSHSRLGRWAQAVELAEATLMRNPNTPEAHILLATNNYGNMKIERARIHHEQGRQVDANAEQCLDQFLERKNETSVLPPTVEIDEAMSRLTDEQKHHMLGLRFFVQQNYSAALPCFEACLVANPYNDTYNDYYGSCLSHLGRDDEAIRYFDRATEANQNNATAWYGLAHSYFMLENLPKAIDYAYHALSIRSDFAEPHMVIAMCNYFKGDRDVAKKHHEQARQLSESVGKRLDELLNLTDDLKSQPETSIAAGLSGELQTIENQLHQEELHSSEFPNLLRKLLSLEPSVEDISPESLRMEYRFHVLEMKGDIIHRIGQRDVRRNVSTGPTMLSLLRIGSEAYERALRLKTQPRIYSKLANLYVFQGDQDRATSTLRKYLEFLDGSEWQNARERIDHIDNSVPRRHNNVDLDGFEYREFLPCVRESDVATTLTRSSSTHTSPSNAIMESGIASSTESAIASSTQQEAGSSDVFSAWLWALAGFGCTLAQIPAIIRANQAIAKGNTAGVTPKVVAIVGLLLHVWWIGSYAWKTFGSFSGNIAQTYPSDSPPAASKKPESEPNSDNAQSSGSSLRSFGVFSAETPSNWPEVKFETRNGDTNVWTQSAGESDGFVRVEYRAKTNYPEGQALVELISAYPKETHAKFLANAEKTGYKLFELKETTMFKDAAFVWEYQRKINGKPRHRRIVYFSSPSKGGAIVFDASISEYENLRACFERAEQTLTER